MKEQTSYTKFSISRSAQAILLGLFLVILQIIGMLLAFQGTMATAYNGINNFYYTSSKEQSNKTELVLETTDMVFDVELMGTLNGTRLSIGENQAIITETVRMNLVNRKINIYPIAELLGGADRTAYVLLSSTDGDTTSLKLYSADVVLASVISDTFDGVAIVTDSDRIVYSSNAMTGYAQRNYGLNIRSDQTQRFKQGDIEYIGGVNTVLDGAYYLLTYADYSASAQQISSLQVRFIIITLLLVLLSMAAFVACVFITGGIGWRGVFGYRVVSDRLGRIVKSNKKFKKDFPDLYALDVNMIACGENSRYALSLTSEGSDYMLSGTVKRRANGTAVLLADKLVVPYGVQLGTSTVEDAETTYYRYLQSGNEVLVGIINFGNLNNLKTMFGQEFASSVRIEIMKKIRSKMLHVYERDFHNITILCESGNEMKHFLEDLPDIMDMLNQPIKIEQNIVNTGIKGGFAISDEKMEQRDYEYASTAANAAMKRAIEDKTAVYYVYHDSQKKLYSKYFFRLDINKMLEENVFELQYQPQYDIKEGKISGFEALFRVRSGISVNANVFEIISYAERSGYMVALGNFIFKTAMEFAKSIEHSGAAVSINVSPVQLMQAGFTENFLSVYRQFDLKEGSICVEITESFLMTTFDETVRKLEVLRKNGIKVHLDDFGTEYSSLLYLKTLPVDVIKIDKSFVDDICTDNYSKSITNLIITSSHELGLKTIVEGVESVQQYNELKELGGDTIQGYLISRAVKTDVAKELLDTFVLPYGCDGSTAPAPENNDESDEI